MEKTFYWYDYETSGLTPKVDRIVQFAGIRTDENLNIIDEKILYCKPTNDCLPSPEACLTTKITPQESEAKGIIEHEFIKKINNEFTTPNTCIVGYNSIRFDDEFTRYTLYRNFFDAYLWHWKNGNTRWNILDVVRLTYAFKKDNSLKWAFADDGKPVFKLEKLTAVNNIEHNPHDALSDVEATINIAKIIKTRQPKLFDYAFSLRNKETVKSNIKLFKPILHTSGMYPSNLSCTRLVIPLVYHPQYPGRVIVFNLDQDPSILLNKNVESLKNLLFNKLPKNVDRLQIKELIFNKSPMFINYTGKIDPKILKQLQINIKQCNQYLEFINKNKNEITEKIKAVYNNNQNKEELSLSNTTAAKTTNLVEDVDQLLYGGFPSNNDKNICSEIQKLSIAELKNFNPKFEDKKLSKLFIHFKARNYPNLLSVADQKYWDKVIQSRIKDGENGYMSLTKYNQQIKTMRDQHPEKENLWQALEEYAKSLL
jgi:exodeoxyribonuclease-1